MVLPVKKGISSPVVPNIPKTWDKEWFRTFINSYLSQTDLRNGSGFTASNTTIDTQLPGSVDPSTSPATAANGYLPVLAKGNAVPMVQSNIFNYTSTTTSITFTWPAYTVYRPDGTNFTIIAGSKAITGLTASTTYTAFVYSTEADPMDIIFAPGMVGTPPVLFAPTATQPQLSLAFAQASKLGNIYQGKITGVTPSSGGGGGGGGGGGYGPCPHQEQDFTTRDGGIVTARSLHVNDYLLTPSGWKKIISLTLSPNQEWIGVYCGKNSIVGCTPDHRFIQPDGQEILAKDLKLGTILQGFHHNHCVQGLLVQYEDAYAVRIELEGPHTYYMTENTPLSHNWKA